MINKIKKVYQKNKEIINYLIIGILTTIVSLLSFYLIRKFLLPENTQLHIQISNIISWILAVLFAFITNKKYVFSSETSGKNAIIEMLKFYFSRITTLLVEILTMWVLTKPLQIDDMISKIIVQFIIVILNYLLSKLFVFTKKSN